MPPDLGTTTEKYDVLIAGYSMLGNVAALILAHHGMRVAVVEKKELSDILLAKSARIDDEVMLIFEQLGLAKNLEKVLYPLKGTQIIDKKERVLLELNQSSSSDFAPLYGFYQPDVQRILQNKAAQHPNIHIFAGYEVETFEQDEQQVNVYVTKTGAQSFFTINASYLIDCNGQYSRIADFLEIETENFGYYNAVLCVDTVCQKKTPLQNYAQTIYDAELPVIRITNDDKHQRWEFQIDQENVKDFYTSEKVRNLLSELSPLHLDIESAFVYNFDSKILLEWRKNRVFIAGDAAHIMPPYLGMGLSAGIKDIYNLAWKIKLVQEGILTNEILDSYQLERAASVRHLIHLNLWIKRLFKSSKLRWIKALIPIIPKWFLKQKLDTTTLVKEGIIGHKSRGAGTHTLSPKIATHKGEVAGFNSILACNFVLIALDKNPVDALQPKQLEILAQLRVQFISITPNRQKFVEDHRYAQNIYDKEGGLEQWFLQHKAQFLILRPDRVVYEFCADAAQLNKVVGGMLDLGFVKQEEED